MAEPETIDFEIREQPQGMNGAHVDNEFQHTLTKPINAHGDEIKVLKWREPTAGDIERAGNPIVIDMFNFEQPRVSFDEKKMSAMISVLCQIPPSSVKQLPSQDWTSVAWKLTGFFMPRMTAG